MMEELKACPFCPDGKGELCAEIEPDMGAGFSGWSIRCRTCFAKTGIYTSEEEAVHAWNRRTSPENDNAEVYLKSYQELLQKSMNLNQELIKKLKVSSPESNPLTLEQLRKMQGQPVWVEPIKSNPAHIIPCWHGIERVNDDRIVFSDCIFWLSGLNKTYHAYARKPEGSEKA